MENIKIKIFSDFCTSEIAKNNMNNVWDLPDIRYPFTFVSDDSYTHVIILGQITPKLSIPKSNVIGFQIEPRPFAPNLEKKSFQKYIKKYVGAYFVHRLTLHELHINEFKEHHTFLWGGLRKKDQDQIYEKKSKMSLIVSEKQQLQGHKYRHILLKRILLSNLPIDLWGNGTDSYKQEFNNDSRIKGSFDDYDKCFAFYFFTIAIENCKEEFYISEKYTTPIKYRTAPIYWGAPGISKVYGENSHISLSGNIEEDMILLKDICENIDLYYSKIAFQDILKSHFEGVAYLPRFLSQIWGNQLSI